MEIQQHDGVVVEVAGFQQGFAKRCGRREVCHGREREAPGLRFCCPPFPPLYIGPLGGASALEIGSQGGAAAKGGGLPPKPSGAPPTPPGFPTLGAGEAQGGRTSPPVAGSPPHFSPWGPPG